MSFVGFPADPALPSLARKVDKNTIFFNVRDYGAVGNGFADDTTAVLAAYAAARAAVGGTVLFPPGVYLISSPIQGSYGYATSAESAPSLVSLTSAGHLGDYLWPVERGAAELVASPSFPVGRYLIDYKENATQGGPAGAWIKGLTLSCAGRSAGFRAVGPRGFHVEDLTINNTATPIYDEDDNPDGAFCITCRPAYMTAGAWNRIDNLTIMTAARNGIYHNCPSEDIFTNCHIWNCSVASISLNTASLCSFYGGTQGGSQWGFDILGWVGVVVNMSTEVVGNTVNAVRNRGGVNSATAPSLQSFIGCKFGNSNAYGGEDGAIMDFRSVGGYLQNCEFTDCEFIADGTGTSYYIYVAASVISGTVKFKGCNFHGVPLTADYIDNSGIGVLTVSDSTGVSALGPSTVREAEVNMGAVPTYGKVVTVADIFIKAGMKVMASQSSVAATGLQSDEAEMDPLMVSARASSAGNVEFTVSSNPAVGPVAGLKRIAYMTST